jgi:hypothetical protein
MGVVDTCCINKNNGAELSEAINSMYRWYRNADVCYNYLDDVKCGSFHPQRESDKEHIELWIAVDYNPGWTPLLESFKKSKWFTRGWTLQELLAPVKSQFYDNSWRLIAGRAYLAKQINEATGIAEKFLWGPAEVREQYIASACVAKKMNWLTRRKTSRAEDMTYCMLGLLGISMPLLYGEGEKAFLRLQMQIISTTDDESIFAWGLPGHGSLKHEHLGDGMLALRPSCFVGSDRVEIYRESERVVDRLPYAMTNRGLQLNVVPDLSEVPDLEYKLELNCYERSENDPYNDRKRPIEILLTKPSSSARLWKRDSSVVLPNPKSKPRNQGGSHLVLNVFQPRDIHEFYYWDPGRD